MPSAKSRFERRFLRELARLVDDEEGTLRRYRLITWGLAIVGGIFLAVSIFTVAAAGSRLFWLVVLAALGGFVCGLGIMYSSAVQQWPILRRYINEQLIRDDAEQPGA